MIKLISLLIFNLLFILTLYLLIKRSLLYKLNKKSVEFAYIFFLFSLGLLITIYVRNIVYTGAIFELGTGSIFASTDESNYIKILSVASFTNLNDMQVSGPGYIFLMRILNQVSGIDLFRIIPVSSYVITPLYLVLMYTGYRFVLKDRLVSALSAILLLTTSYYFWPTLEQRPQLFGMIFVFFIAALYHRYAFNPSKKLLSLIMVFILGLFLIHILSFFLFLPIILLFMIIYRYIHGTTIKSISPVYFSLGGIFILFLSAPAIFAYGGSRGAVNYIFSSANSFILKTFGQHILLISILSILAIFLVLVFLPKSKCLYSTLHHINPLRDYIRKYGNLFFVLMVFLAFTALFVQYLLRAPIYSAFYKNSVMYFIILQLGNIFFGLTYLRGLLDHVGERNLDTNKTFFVIGSVALMLIGACFLIASLFFVYGWNNLLIRVINYWTLFAAPLISITLLKYMNLKNVEIKKVLYVILMISFLITISTINVSRDPAIFNNNVYWSKSDILSAKFPSYNTEESNHNYIIKTDCQTMNRLIPIIQMKHNKKLAYLLLWSPSVDVRYHNKIYVASEIEIYV